MALIKMSSLGITNLVGKAGGTIYSHNKGGAYAKNYVKPSNPQTFAQTHWRNCFAQVAALWRSLTTVQKDSFKAHASEYPVQNKLGDTIILSARALFQMLNNRLAAIGAPIGTLHFITSLDTPVAVYPHIANDMTISISPAGILTVGGSIHMMNDAPSDQVFLYRASSFHTASSVSAWLAPINFFKSPVDNREETIFISTSAEVGIAKDLLTIIGKPLVNDIIEITTNPISVTTGNKGADYTFVVTVTASV